MNDNKEKDHENIEYSEYSLHNALGISDERIEQVQEILKNNWTKGMTLNDILQWTVSTKLLTTEERVIIAYAAGLDRQDMDNKENIERAYSESENENKQEQAQRTQDHER